MNTQESGFKQILNAAKERRGDLSVDTMIVSSHLSANEDVHVETWYRVLCRTR